MKDCQCLPNHDEDDTLHVNIDRSIDRLSPVENSWPSIYAVAQATSTFEQLVGVQIASRVIFKIDSNNMHRQWFSITVSTAFVEELWFLNSEDNVVGVEEQTHTQVSPLTKQSRGFDSCTMHSMHRQCYVCSAYYISKPSCTHHMITHHAVCLYVSCWSRHAKEPNLWRSNPVVQIY